MYKKIVIIALMLLSSVDLFAGGNKRGEAGFMFLKIPVGARETSMGVSGLTMTTGASAMYWNPANVSAMDRPNFQVSYLNYAAGISTNYAAVSFPISDIGVFGLSLNYVNYGSIDITTEANPGGTGATYSPYELAFGVSYSKQVTDRVSGGMTLKFLGSQIDRVSAQGVAFDIGFMYNTDFRGLKMGFAITNIGPQSKYEGDGMNQEVILPSTVDPSANDERVFFKYGAEPFELPAAVNFGISMDIYRNEQNSLVGTLEQNVNSYQAGRTNFGVEYGFNNMFFARGGYTSTLQKDKDYKTGEAFYAGLTLGAGVDYKLNDKFGATVDYGYLDMGMLGGTHRFTVGLKF
ncbi:PorV/PorQ family protein [bacterium]|nr:PorV/PorQ family protein [bacterium]